MSSRAVLAALNKLDDESYGFYPPVQSFSHCHYLVAIPDALVHTVRCGPTAR